MRVKCLAGIVFGELLSGTLSGAVGIKTIIQMDKKAKFPELVSVGETLMLFARRVELKDGHFRRNLWTDEVEDKLDGGLAYPGRPEGIIWSPTYKLLFPVELIK